MVTLTALILTHTYINTHTPIHCKQTKFIHLILILFSFCWSVTGLFYLSLWWLSPPILGTKSWSWFVTRWWEYFLPWSSSQWWVHSSVLTFVLQSCYAFTASKEWTNFSLFPARAVRAVWAAGRWSLLLSGDGLLQKWWHRPICSRHLASICCYGSSHTLLCHLEIPLCPATQSGWDLQMTSVLTSQRADAVFEWHQRDQVNYVTIQRLPSKKGCDLCVSFRGLVCWASFSC